MDMLSQKGSYKFPALPPAIPQRLSSSLRGNSQHRRLMLPASHRLYFCTKKTLKTELLLADCIHMGILVKLLFV